MKRYSNFYRLAALLFALLMLASCAQNPSFSILPPSSGSVEGESVMADASVSLPKDSDDPSAAPTLPNVPASPSGQASDQTSKSPSVSPDNGYEEPSQPSFLEPPSADPSPSPIEPNIPTELPKDQPKFLCEQAFVYDVDNDCFWFLSGEDRIIYPASTTKLLTILYARTLLPLEQRVRPGNELELVKVGSSIAYVKKHHILTVEQLIEGMLLPSGNDAAYVLAAAGGRVLDPDAKDGKEAVAAFLVGMNEYAAKLGVTGSNFTNPDGYDDLDHYSTLEDMALIARYAYNDPIIRKYCNVVSDDVTYASGHLMTWTNTNSCLHQGSAYYSPYVNGLKTGTVNKEYYCLLSSAQIGERSFIFGFFGEKQAYDRFKDTLTAIEWIRKSGLVEFP